MSATPDEATADPSARLEAARDHAESGRLDEAAALFRHVMDTGGTVHRAQAALGLAVVLEGAGDHDGARAADRVAIETGDPEYGARAAYHLALSWERAGERDRARDAWHAVADFGTAAYLPPAYLALAQLADDEGEPAQAREWWERAIATGDEQYAPVAAHDLALRLIEWGEPGRAQQVLIDALRLVDRDRDPHGHARLAVGLGIAHLEQAISAFGSVTPGDDADPEVVPLAIELLARTLPLRGRDEAAQDIWRRGLDDPALGEHVRARLRRTFGGAGADGLWWEDHVEAALRANALPVLAGEAFGALDHMYAVIAARHADGPQGLPEDVFDVLDQAVAVPERYPWGPALRDSFGARLRQAMDGGAAVPPPARPGER